MTPTEKILAGYIELIAQTPADGRAYSGITGACMVMDKVGADMADNASPHERAEIFRTMRTVREYVLNRAHSLPA